MSYPHSIHRVIHTLSTKCERLTSETNPARGAIFMQKVSMIMANQQEQPEKKQRKPKGRGSGEGSVFERKGGNRKKPWVAQVTLESGEKKQTYHATQKEAIVALRNMQHELEQGRLATGAQQKLKGYLEEWFEEVYRPTIRLSTYLRYRGILNNHIVPALGHIAVQKLTTRKIQAFYADKEKEGLSASSIHAMHKVLRRALANAMKWRLVSYNACDGVSLPKVVRPKIHPLTPEQARRLLEVVKGHPLEALILVALTTGVRHGELAGLQWGDIDLDKGSLHIQRIVSRLGRYKYVEREPKTESSRRMLMLPRFVLDILKVHRTRQLEARLKAGEKWQDHGLVFCNRRGGFLYPDVLLGQFHRVLAQAGLPRMRLHDLRHSAATILLSMGVPAKVIQEILGHSTIGMTMNIYSHVLPVMQKDATDKWDDFFGEGK